jgi:radical SAM superfamily enzyme YgiQ (UPF0313 family)
MFPQSALEYLGADMGIQGEGEAAFPVLLKHIEQQADLSGVSGLYLRGQGLQAKRTYIKDLDSLPFPEPSLLVSADAEKANYWLPFQTRRGCPLDCSYCSTATIEGHLVRTRSAAAAVRELSRWAGAGFSQVFFVDNTFNLPPPYAMDLCNRLAAAALDVTWRCILYPLKISEDLVKAMAGAGCCEVSLGFESGNNDILRALNKRFDTGEIRQANRILKDYKITLGIRIYPHTDLAKTAIEEGQITADDNLLSPRFYIDPELKEWLEKYVNDRARNRPSWFL